MLLLLGIFALTVLGVFLTTFGLIQISSGMTLGLSSDKILETQQLILLGTVDSAEVRSGETEYIINVLEYVKTPSGFNKVDTLHAVGCGEGQIGGCITFDERQDVLFILNERNDALLVSELSFVSPNPNCTINDLFRYNDEKYDGLSVYQDSKNNHYLYTNQPITAQYHYFNKNLKATSVDVKITVVNDFPDILKEETIHLELDECQPNARAEMEFVIDSPGSFAISAKVEGNGGVESFSGVKVIEHVESPLKQFKSGVPIDEIQCRDGLELIIKSSGDSLACVRPETKQKLVEGGWAIGKEGGFPDLNQKTLPKFEIIGLNYAVHPDEPLMISVEKTGYDRCDSWDARIINVSDNSVVWERDYFTSCVVLDPPKQQQFEYRISGKDRPIVVSEVGSYVFQITIGDTYLEKEFVVRNNFSGKSLERTVYPVPWETRSPLKQFKDGIDPKVIHCNNGLILLQRYDGTSACVNPETKQKLIERGWARDDALSTFDYIIEKDGVTYGSQYQISGGIVDEIVYNKHTNSLIVSLGKSENGFIQIVIQTGLLHLPDEVPYTYIVIADGKEIDFEQLSPIILKIPFEEGTKQIEIAGTLEI